MNWKFSCETKKEIPLPPEYTFSQAFNYLNPEVNSFYILENEHGYIQCAGSKQACTVEIREFGTDGAFNRHTSSCHAEYLVMQVWASLYLQDKTDEKKDISIIQAHVVRPLKGYAFCRRLMRSVMRRVTIRS